ncbi:TetR/AcrR family transcriptional regulator [Nesterenkonia lutea]|uniref:AcrR family transcriptional regulator n=1 Tax=Nesterenkonia lutea TaxID=272919 RepID=A0ABR9JAE3_9MICC|nr:TetR/AcrR family transcriptional regulator [Nesterenkonia lutea]MBE1522884.1 AcrR family transcriptional regulator [Nesterenkonia lutea]
MSLSAALITETARTLLIHYGLPDVSMRRLAKELGVAPGALYYHVSSKQELLTRVARAILSPLEEQPGDARTLMLRFRELVLPLRDAGDLLLLAYALDPQLPPAHLLPARLSDTGWEAGEAHRITQVVMRFALGAVATEQNQRLLSGEEEPSAGGAATSDAPQAAEAELIYLHGLERLLHPPAAQGMSS